jgi:hypothetical protein
MYYVFSNRELSDDFTVYIVDAESEVTARGIIQKDAPKSLDLEYSGTLEELMEEDADDDLFNVHSLE